MGDGGRHSQLLALAPAQPQLRLALGQRASRWKLTCSLALFLSNIFFLKFILNKQHRKACQPPTQVPPQAMVKAHDYLTAVVLCHPHKQDSLPLDDATQPRAGLALCSCDLGDRSQRWQHRLSRWCVDKSARLYLATDLLGSCLLRAAPTGATRSV